MSSTNTTQSPKLPPLNVSIPIVKTIMHTVMIVVVPMTSNRFDRSTKSAISGCMTTASTLAAASVIPICEFVYPFASMNTEAKLLTTA